MILPPLVAATGTLSKAEIERYSRHVLLPEFGMAGQKRLKNSRVLVVGAGGLGSPALLYLAAAGVGTLGIVDFDRVEESNLQRQIVHSMASLGQNKAESAKAAVLGLNPHVQVQLHTERLEPHNALDMIQAYDVVLDGTDNFATRYLVNDACVLAHKPCVWGSIFRFEGQASVFWEQAPGGMGLNYRDLYPEAPPPELAPSCSEGGVLGVLCAAIGGVMATEAIKLITGIGNSLLGRLLVYDALEMRHRCLPLRRSPSRPVITHLSPNPAPTCSLGAPSLGLAQGPTQGLTQGLSVHTLHAWRQAGQACVLVDIRDANEREIVSIANSLAAPKDELLAGQHRELLAANTQPVVLYCKTGKRSALVLKTLHAEGLHHVQHLEGGIVAWVRDIEPNLPSY